MDLLSETNQVAQGRIQLYVDDPAVTLQGTVDQQHAAVDLLTLWWLILGIPFLGTRVPFALAASSTIGSGLGSGLLHRVRLRFPCPHLSWSRC